MTYGNLSNHLQLLEHADLIEMHKGFKHNKPLTTVVLTAKGEQSIGHYWDQMELLARLTRPEDLCQKTSDVR